MTGLTGTDVTTLPEADQSESERTIDGWVTYHELLARLTDDFVFKSHTTGNAREPY
jgi:hypothetical protein